MSPQRWQGSNLSRTVLFHLVSLDNLESILRTGALLSLTQVDTRGLGYRNIGHEHIKDRRRRRAVPLGPRGVVADYVPFYFAPCSPMLFVLHRGEVRGFTGSQDDLVYLCTTVQDVIDQGAPWVFTDRHAELGATQFFDDPVAIPLRIDWDLMNAQYWASNPEDPDRRERRQAEFLVLDLLPWSSIQFLGARTQAAAERARTKIQATATDHDLNIDVRPQWYF